MLRSIGSVLILLSPMFVRASDPGASGPCADMPPGQARAGCLEARYSSGILDTRGVEDLEAIVRDDPALGERLASLADGALVGAEPSQIRDPKRDRIRARVLDLRAQALGRLGRVADAADLYRTAVALDDGINHLAWLTEDGRTAWAASLDPGDGRLVRAAKALAAAGRPDPARALLARAIGAGAAEPAGGAWDQLGGGRVPGLDAEPSDLTAITWYPRLPDVEMKLEGAGTFRPSDALGKVLVLDFWASWCAPCLRELPQLQALFDAEKDAGLVVVTVNARESRQAAESARRALGISLPMAHYDDAADRSFRVRALPTLILADRDGRIRARWDNYVPDFEGEVAAKVRSLLRNKFDPAPHRAAEVLAGAGTLKVLWMRELSAPIEGVAVSRARAGAPIAATVGGKLVTFGADGAIVSRREIPPAGAGRLRSVQDGAREGEDLVGFRPGRQEFVWLDSRSGAARTTAVSRPIFDLQLLPHGVVADAPPRLAVATDRGVATVGSDGRETAWPAPTEEICALAFPGHANGPRAVTASRSGVLGWNEIAGKEVGRAALPEASCGGLLTDDGIAGAGVLPDATTASVVGRFVDSARPQAAVATSTGQLAIVELFSGTVRFRARWPGIGALAGGDLDGDGQDELVVAAGRTIAVLGRAVAPAERPQP